MGTTIIWIIIFLVIALVVYIGIVALFDLMYSSKIKIANTIVAIVTIGVIIFCIILGFSAKVTSAKVTATVIDKKYDASYITTTTVGKTITTIVHPSSYYIKLKYNKYTGDIDNEELYNKLKINDKIRVKLIITKYSITKTSDIDFEIIGGNK